MVVHQICLKCFNLKREANPLATEVLAFLKGVQDWFQSQARSQPSGDDRHPGRSLHPKKVSISSEKPTLWRLDLCMDCAEKRDLFQSQARSQPSGDPMHTVSHKAHKVSISSEKPTLWRRCISIVCHSPGNGFNLKREANPLATNWRCNACFGLFKVSISSEKPTLWRLVVTIAIPVNRFVSISSEKPTLWRRDLPTVDHVGDLCFNLKREANPLATTIFTWVRESNVKFQSQARSQPSGDGVIVIDGYHRWKFQSQARSQPSGDEHGGRD